MPDPFERLQLRHYRLIRAIAEHGQVSIAADAMAMTQPAASRALAEIERLVDLPLFERHPKGVRPTPMGEAMARYATMLLGDLDQASQEFRAFRAGRAGTVRVGAVTGAAVGYLVPAIQALKAETQDLDIRVSVAPSVDLVSDLIGGRLDFVLGRLPADADKEKLDILKGHVEHVELLVGADHPLAGRSDVTLAELARHVWIMQAPGMPIRDAIEDTYFRADIAPPQNVIETASLLMTIAYLQCSDSIAPVAREVSDLLVKERSGGLVNLHMQEAIRLSPYHLVRQKDRMLSPAATRLLHLVQDRLSD